MLGCTSLAGKARCLAGGRSTHGSALLHAVALARVALLMLDLRAGFENGPAERDEARARAAALEEVLRILSAQRDMIADWLRAVPYQPAPSCHRRPSSVCDTVEPSPPRQCGDPAKVLRRRSERGSAGDTCC